MDEYIVIKYDKTSI